MWTSMVHGYWFGECNLGLFCYVVFLLAQLFTLYTGLHLPIDAGNM